MDRGLIEDCLLVIGEPWLLEKELSGDRRDQGAGRSSLSGRDGGGRTRSCSLPKKGEAMNKDVVRKQNARPAGTPS